MEKIWRWFGRKDRITLDMLRQIGVEGIVTALHDVQNGEVWSREKIRDLREYIESYGMRWSVVESLPVCESIKYGGPDRDRLIENYKESLRNLSAEGIRVNAIAPGFFITEQNRSLLTNPDGTYTQRGQDVIRQTPFGRMGEPEELCGTIHYLMSDASKFVTGIVAVVDGGFNVFAM